MKWKTLTFILILYFCSTITVQAETVYLSVAASMTDAFKEIATDFTKAHPEIQLRPNFASSGSLAKQIAQGAPSDIYVSANPKWMNFLVEQEMIQPGTNRIFAYNSLVFIGRRDLPSMNIEGLKNLDLIALGNPRNVPAGQYAKQAMERMNIYAALENGRKLVMAKDVRQALLYADRGEVDGAFVYATDAPLATNTKLLFTVPEDLYDQVSYPLGLTVSGAKSNAARIFYEYMKSSEVMAILKRFGFKPIP